MSDHGFESIQLSCGGNGVEAFSFTGIAAGIFLRTDETCLARASGITCNESTERQFSTIGDVIATQERATARLSPPGKTFWRTSPLEVISQQTFE